jgi:hypothetical protein
MGRFPISTLLSRVSGAAFRLFVFLGSDNLPQPTDHNRLLIWKLSYKCQASPNSFHEIPQGGKQQSLRFSRRETPSCPILSVRATIFGFC